MKQMDSNRGSQLAGLLLWRIGLAIAGATALYRTARLLLEFIELPLQIEIGAGLLFCGAVLVMVSLVWERIADWRREGDLTQ